MAELIAATSAAGVDADAESVLAVCVVGNKPVKVAADFLRRGLNGQQAGREILVMRVEESGPEIYSTVLPGDGANAEAEAKPAKSLAQRMADKFKRQ